MFVTKMMPAATAQQQQDFDEYSLATASPEVAAQVSRVNFAINVKEQAARVQCPTLVFHSRPKGAFLAVPEGSTPTVTCLRGALWITHDNMPADIVISAGESYTRQHAGRMLVFALHDSTAMVA